MAEKWQKMVRKRTEMAFFGSLCKSMVIFQDNFSKKIIYQYFLILILMLNIPLKSHEILFKLTIWNSDGRTIN